MTEARSLQRRPSGRLALEGRVAVVTGGASGLGAATSRALQSAGASVAIIDLNVSSLDAFVGETGIVATAADVSDERAIESAFDEIDQRLGAVSILVNCAGVATPGTVVRKGAPMPLEEFRRVIEVNLLGAINCIRCAVPRMIEGARAAGLSPSDEAGVVINTASIAAFDGQVGQAAYSASKGGVAGMVLPLTRELGDYGIRVMGIAPGVFETPMTLELPAKSREKVFAAKPPFPRRPGAPEEFAQLVLSIVANPMLNGEVIRLDAGLRMPALV